MEFKDYNSVTVLRYVLFITMLVCGIYLVYDGFQQNIVPSMNENEVGMMYHSAMHDRMAELSVKGIHFYKFSCSVRSLNPNSNMTIRINDFTWIFTFELDCGMTPYVDSECRLFQGV